MLFMLIYQKIRLYLMSMLSHSLLKSYEYLLAQKRYHILTKSLIYFLNIYINYSSVSLSALISEQSD